LAASIEYGAFDREILPRIRQDLGIGLLGISERLTPEYLQRIRLESLSKCTRGYAKKTYIEYKQKQAESAIAYQTAKTQDEADDYSRAMETRKLGFLEGIIALYMYGYSDALKENIVYREGTTIPLHFKESSMNRFTNCDSELRAANRLPAVQYEDGALQQEPLIDDTAEEAARKAKNERAGQGEGGTRRRRRTRRHKQKKNKTKARKVKGKKSRR
jgi:hypothetical protein